MAKSHVQKIDVEMENGVHDQASWVPNNQSNV